MNPISSEILNYLWIGVELAIVVVAAFIIDRLALMWIRKFSQKAKLSADVENGLKIISRILILLGAVSATMHIGGLPAEWFVGFTALGGTAIGFASSRTIGNLIAGLYVLLSDPFDLGDYVTIDGVEGIIEEITINYTKVKTPENNTVILANQEILGKKIRRLKRKFDGKELYCYTFQAGFDASISSDRLEKGFREVSDEFSDKMPRKPEWYVYKIGRLEITYIFYLYFERAEDIFNIPPLFMQRILKIAERAKAMR